MPYQYSRRAGLHASCAGSPCIVIVHCAKAAANRCKCDYEAPASRPLAVYARGGHGSPLSKPIGQSFLGMLQPFKLFGKRVKKVPVDCEIEPAAQCTSVVVGMQWSEDRPSWRSCGPTLSCGMVSRLSPSKRQPSGDMMVPAHVLIVLRRKRVSNTLRESTSRRVRRRHHRLVTMHVPHGARCRVYLRGDRARTRSP